MILISELHKMEEGPKAGRTGEHAIDSELLKYKYVYMHATNPFVSSLLASTAMIARTALDGAR